MASTISYFRPCFKIWSFGRGKKAWVNFCGTVQRTNELPWGKKSPNRPNLPFMLSTTPIDKPKPTYRYSPKTSALTMDPWIFKIKNFSSQQGWSRITYGEKQFESNTEWFMIMTVTSMQMSCIMWFGSKSINADNNNMTNLQSLVVKFPSKS